MKTIQDITFAEKEDKSRFSPRGPAQQHWGGYSGGNNYRHHNDSVSRYKIEDVVEVYNTDTGKYHLGKIVNKTAYKEEYHVKVYDLHNTFIWMTPKEDQSFMMARIWRINSKIDLR